MNTFFYALMALVLGINSPTFSIDSIDELDKDQHTQRTVGEDGNDPEEEDPDS